MHSAIKLTKENFSEKLKGELKSKKKMLNFSCLIRLSYFAHES